VIWGDNIHYKKVHWANFKKSISVPQKNLSHGCPKVTDVIKLDKFCHSTSFVPTIVLRKDRLSIFLFITSLTKSFLLRTRLRRLGKWSLREVYPWFISQPKPGRMIVAFSKPTPSQEFFFNIHARTKIENHMVFSQLE
jgi:hypothetical protein